MPASRRMPTYRRAARSETPSLSASRSAVMPGAALDQLEGEQRPCRGARVGLHRAPPQSGSRTSGNHPSGRGMDMTTDDIAILRWPPAAGTEVDTLIGSLERQRRTFAWKCGGLDSAGLRATTAATTMTLGGLLKHLALVEADYFTLKLHGEDPGPPWNAVNWEADPNWEWRTAAEDTPEQLYALWEESVSAPGPTSLGRWPTAARAGRLTSSGPTASPRASDACSST